MMLNAVKEVKKNLKAKDDIDAMGDFWQEVENLKAFEEKKAFLPQLLMSAEAATAAFEQVKAAIPAGDAAASASRPFIIATVQGDIHDIGKNIVRVLLESFGFLVYDLGRDVPPEVVVEKAKETG